MHTTAKGCSVTGCTGKHKGLGFCQKHRRAYRKLHPAPPRDVIYHGLSNSTEFNSWRAMMERCYGKTYHARDLYKNIEVYPEWRNSFKAFYDYIGPKPDPTYSLDRIDGTKNYEPGNVRWASKRTQARNQRLYRNTTSGYKGISRNASGNWKAHINIDYKPYHLGTYPTKELAALVYDAAAIQIYGDEAHPNIL